LTRNVEVLREGDDARKEVPRRASHAKKYDEDVVKTA